MKQVYFAVEASILKTAFKAYLHCVDNVSAESGHSIKKVMVIAVDFDGTIVEHRYPAIGKEIPFSIATLKKLQTEGNLLILWTVREGELLEEAVEFCRKRGLEFYAVNANHPDEQLKPDMSTSCRKVVADMYIDDRNVGKLPDWGAIYEMAHNRWSYERYLQEMHGNAGSGKPGFWQRLFCR